MQNNKVILKGENHPSWKGGRIKTSGGYIMIYKKEHPFAMKSGYILEHRLIMEKVIGRYLLPHEVVDHINGVKDDNRIENLRLFASQSDHILEEVRRGKYKKTTEWVKKIVDNRRSYVGAGNPFYGKKLSPERIEGLRKVNKKGHNKQCRICKTKIYVIPSRINHKYCSIRCKNEDKNLYANRRSKNY